MCRLCFQGFAIWRDQHWGHEPKRAIALSVLTHVCEKMCIYVCVSESVCVCVCACAILSMCLNTSTHAFTHTFVRKHKTAQHSDKQALTQTQLHKYAQENKRACHIREPSADTQTCLCHDIWHHVPIVILARPHKASTALKSLRHHVVNQPGMCMCACVLVCACVYVYVYIYVCADVCVRVNFRQIPLVYGKMWCM
jgi:hypothetical protein